MPTSIACTLDLLHGDIPEGMINAQVWRRVTCTAASFPAVLARQIYLEFRLAAGNPRVDLAIGVNLEGGQVIAGRNPVIALPVRLRQHPLWSPVIDFCRRWCTSGSLQNALVRRIWLEFDLPNRSKAAVLPTPVPAVFVELRRGAFLDLCPVAKADTLYAVVAPLLKTFTADRLRRTLKEAIEPLPPSASVRYTGLLLSRRTEKIRLCVTGLTAPATRDYLQRADWNGCLNKLQDLTEEVAPSRRGAQFAEPGVVDLNVGDEVDGKIGLEYVFAREPQLRGRIEEQPFLELLVDRGWCDPGKIRDLCIWPGYAIGHLPHTIWAEITARRLNHVKLTINGSSPVEAKAYLAASYQTRTLSSSNLGRSKIEEIL